MSDIDYDPDVSYPPWNFSWVVKNELAAMAWPQSDSNLRYLVEQGISHLITLSPEKKPNVYNFPELMWTEIPVEEFEPPSIAHIKKFIEVCKRCNITNKAIGIHCRMGKGRCGVMAACYLVHFKDQSPERAMINLRRLRPGSIETEEQAQAVVKYHECLRGVQKIVKDEPDFLPAGPYFC